MEKNIEDRKNELVERLINELSDYPSTHSNINSEILRKLNIAEQKFEVIKNTFDIDQDSAIKKIIDFQFWSSANKEFDLEYACPFGICDSLVLELLDELELIKKTLKVENYNNDELLKTLKDFVKNINIAIDKNEAHSYLNCIKNYVEDERKQLWCHSENYIDILLDVVSLLYKAQEQYEMLASLSDDLMFTVTKNEERLVRICYKKDKFVRILYKTLCDDKDIRDEEDYIYDDEDNVVYKIHTFPKISKGVESKGFAFLEKSIVFNGEYVPYTNLLLPCLEERTMSKIIYDVTQIKTKVMKKTAGVLNRYFKDVSKLIVERSDAIFPKCNKFSEGDGYALHAHKIELEEEFTVDNLTIDNDIYRLTNILAYSEKNKLYSSANNNKCIWGNTPHYLGEGAKRVKLNCRICQ